MSGCFSSCYLLRLCDILDTCHIHLKYLLSERKDKLKDQIDRMVRKGEREREREAKSVKIVGDLQGP